MARQLKYGRLLERYDDPTNPKVTIAIYEDPNGTIWRTRTIEGDIPLAEIAVPIIRAHYMDDEEAYQ